MFLSEKHFRGTLEQQKTAMHNDNIDWFKLREAIGLPMDTDIGRMVNVNSDGSYIVESIRHRDERMKDGRRQHGSQNRR